MTSLLMWYSSHLQRKQFPITRNKITYFHMHISISEFSSHVVGYQVEQPYTCKECNKNMQFMATSPYYDTTTSTSCKSQRSKILDCLTSCNHNEDIYKLHHKSVHTGLALQLVPNKVMVITMATFLGWAVNRQ